MSSVSFNLNFFFLFSCAMYAARWTKTNRCNRPDHFEASNRDRNVNNSFKVMHSMFLSRGQMPMLLLQIRSDRQLTNSPSRLKANTRYTNKKPCTFPHFRIHLKMSSTLLGIFEASQKRKGKTRFCCNVILLCHFTSATAAPSVSVVFKNDSILPQASCVLCAPVLRERTDSSVVLPL